MAVDCFLGSYGDAAGKESRNRKHTVQDTAGRVVELGIPSSTDPCISGVFQNVGYSSFAVINIENLPSAQVVDSTEHAHRAECHKTENDDLGPRRIVW